MSLFKELKRKMGIKTEDEDEATGTSTGRSTSTSTNKHVGNTRAKKKARNIKLGWIHEGKTVRLRTGGGSRTV